jgi:hypothetical protein
MALPDIPFPEEAPTLKTMRAVQAESARSFVPFGNRPEPRVAVPRRGLVAKRAYLLIGAGTIGVALDSTAISTGRRH